MWCANCQADVAGEVSADARSLLCTTCGGEVSSIKAPINLRGARGAQELLDRWNTEEILDPYQPGRRTAIPTADDADFAIEPADSETKPHRRIDSAHVEPIVQQPVETESDEQTEVQREPRVARRPSQRSFRVDAGHAVPDGGAVPPPHDPRDDHVSVAGRIDRSHDHAPSPHFNISSAFEDRRKPGHGETVWGQLLAYAGVGVLTVGTGLVVWGYFGGPDNYTPTGWLLATAGQMLLFLGVVTLISGGMEQTTHAVTQRIERLGDHIIRIERHATDQSLRGPHFETGNRRESRPSDGLVQRHS